MLLHEDQRVNVERSIPWFGCHIFGEFPREIAEIKYGPCQSKSM